MYVFLCEQQNVLKIIFSLCHSTRSGVLFNTHRNYSYSSATHPPTYPHPLVHGRSLRTPAPQGRGIPSAAYADE